MTSLVASIPAPCKIRSVHTKSTSDSKSSRSENRTCLSMNTHFLLRLQGHQQPRYWPRCINGQFSSSRKDFKYLIHLSVRNWQIIIIASIFTFGDNSVRNRLYTRSIFVARNRQPWLKHYLIHTPWLLFIRLVQSTITKYDHQLEGHYKFSISCSRALCMETFDYTKPRSATDQYIAFRGCWWFWEQRYQCFGHVPSCYLELSI